MKTNGTKRLLAMLLAALMMFSLLPTSVFAEGESSAPVVVQEQRENDTDSVVEEPTPAPTAEPVEEPVVVPVEEEPAMDAEPAEVGDGEPVAKIGEQTYTSLALAIAAVPTDGTATTIQMVADTTLDAAVTFPTGVNVTLDLNDCVISGTISSYSTGLITNNGTLTIKDTGTNHTGKISDRCETSSVYTIRNNSALTIESGTIEAIGAGTSGVHGIYFMGGSVTMTGGTITATGGGTTVDGINVQSSTATLEITNGSISATSTKSNPSSAYAVYAYNIQSGSISGGDISGTTSAIKNLTYTIEVSGGTFSSDASAYCIGGKCTVLNPTSGKYEVTDLAAENAVAGVGGVYYGSLRKAASSVTGTGTVTLLKDITETSAVEIRCGASANVTLDLNGKTITGDLWVYDVASLTITGSGYITGSYPIANMGSGTITVLNGHVSATSSCIYGSNVTVQGGYFNKDISSYCATGYECVANTGADKDTYGYVVQAKAPVVAKIGTSEYASLALAVAAVDGIDGKTATITMQKNETLTEALTIPAGNTITLDLNDCIISGTFSTLITNNGTLTIKDTGTNGTGGITGNIASSAKLTVFSGAITGDVTVSAGTFALSDGIITGNVSASGAMTVAGGRITGNVTADDTGTLNMTAGTVDGNVTLAVATGSSVSGGKLGGTVSSTTAGSFVSGGYYVNEVGSGYLVKYANVVSTPDGAEKTAGYVYTVELEFVCEIGDTKYGSLKDAVAADLVASKETGYTGSTIKMLNDFKTDGTTTIAYGQIITLELDGYVISSVSNQCWTDALISNSGVLTIQDTSEAQTGKITTDVLQPNMDPVPGYASNTITNYNTVNVLSGTIINTSTQGLACFAIDCQAPHSGRDVYLNISGGTIRSAHSVAIREYLNTSNANNVDITGGTISSIWVQNDKYTAQKNEKGHLNIKDAYIEGNIGIGYWDNAFGKNDDFTVNIDNIVCGDFEILNYELREGQVTLGKILQRYFPDDPTPFVLQTAEPVIPGMIKGELNPSRFGNDVTDYCEDGYYTILITDEPGVYDGYWKMAKDTGDKPESDYAAEVYDSEGKFLKKYVFLETAWNSVPEGGTLKLLKDGTFDQYHYVKKEMTVDLNNFTLTNTESKNSAYYIEAPLTVKNGTLKSTEELYAKSSCESLSFENATIESTGSYAIMSAAVDLPINMNGNTVVKTSASDAILNYYGLVITATGTGNQIVATGTGYDAVYGYDGVKVTGEGEVTISGKYCGLHISDYYTYSEFGIAVDNPNATITGDSYAVSIKKYSSSTGDKTDLDISDGKYSGYVYTDSENLTITGGIYTTYYNAAWSVKEGYCLGSNTDESTLSDYPYSVEKAKVRLRFTYNDEETVLDYRSIAAANSDALYYYEEYGETNFNETLLDDHAENAAFPEGLNITLDLDGHTLSVPEESTDPVITNNGTLTISDTAADSTGGISGEITSSAALTVSSGSITGDIEATAGTITVTGGTITGNVTAENTGALTMSAGTVKGNVTTSTGTHTLSGGTVSGSISTDGSMTLSGTTVVGIVSGSSTATVSVSSGSIGGINASGTAVVTGGTITGNITATATGKLTMSDGTVTGDVTLTAATGSSVSGGRFDGTVKATTPGGFVSGGFYITAPVDTMLVDGKAIRDTNGKERNDVGMKYLFTVDEAQTEKQKTTNNSTVTNNTADDCKVDDAAAEKRVDDTVKNTTVQNYTNDNIKDATTSNDKNKAENLKKVKEALINQATLDIAGEVSTSELDPEDQQRITEIKYEVDNITGDTSMIDYIVVKTQDATVANFTITTVTTGDITTGMVTTMSFDVKPYVETTVNPAGGDPYKITTVIPNDAITDPIPFTLPIDASVPEGTLIRVYHQDTKADDKTVFGYYPTKVNDKGEKYIELASDHFSIFSYELVNKNINSLFSVNIALDDSIDVNFFVDYDVIKNELHQDPADYAVSSVFKPVALSGEGNENIETNKNVILTNGTPVNSKGAVLDSFDTEGVKYSKLTVSSSAARQMTQPVYIQVTYKDDIVFEYQYSVRQYCTDMVDDYKDQTGEKAAQLVSLCKAVLDYGKGAQMVFSYQHDRAELLANYNYSNFTCRADWEAIATSKDCARKITKGNSIIKTGNASLSLKSKTSLNIYFNVTSSDKEIDSFTVTKNGETLTVDPNTIQKSGSTYLVPITGITCLDLDAEYEVVASSTAGDVTITYCPLAYAYSKSVSGTDNYKYLAHALQNYSNWAEAYFTSAS